MSPPYSVVFCGTPEFAVPSLEALIADPAFSVDLVVTQPDKPVGRKQVVTPPPVKVCATQHGIPVVQPKNINTDDSLKNLHPDFLVVVAYGQILNDDILSIPSIAPINVHASMLPRWRGASPIQHALLAGDTTTGVTVQRMVKELDAGPVLSQKEVAIDARETTETLHDKLAAAGAILLVETLKNTLTESEQTGEVSICKKLSRTDGDIDLKNLSAEEADRTVRALVPWPGVRCTINGQSLKLLETSLIPADEALDVECADDKTLYVAMLQPSGKKPMSGADWKRGQKNTAR